MNLTFSFIIHKIEIAQQIKAKTKIIFIFFYFYSKFIFYFCGVKSTFLNNNF